MLVVRELVDEFMYKPITTYKIKLVLIQTNYSHTYK